MQESKPLLFALNDFERGRFYRVNPNVVPRMGDVLEKDMAYNA